MSAPGHSPQYLLALKRARTYLLAHPGSTNDEVRAACDCGPMGLQERGLAYWTRNKEGKAIWFAKSGLAYPKVGVNP